MCWQVQLTDLAITRAANDVFLRDETIRLTEPNAVPKSRQRVHRRVGLPLLLITGHVS